MTRKKDNPLLRRSIKATPIKATPIKMALVEKLALIIVLELLCIIAFLIMEVFH